MPGRRNEKMFGGAAAPLEVSLVAVSERAERASGIGRPSARPILPDS
jgi:hypothetical protein